MSRPTNPAPIAWLPEIIQKPAHGTLVIGDLQRWSAEGRGFAALQDFHFTDIADLNAELIDRLDTEIILSALVADAFDAVDVAVKLIDLDYRGKYRALADQSVDAPLITKEIRSLSPNLDFDLLVLGPPAQGANAP
ncbi:MAG: hypothetical protein AAF801_17495 [Pseudomonadota bacterium]